MIQLIGEFFLCGERVLARGLRWSQTEFLILDCLGTRAVLARGGSIRAERTKAAGILLRVYMNVECE